MQLFWFEFKKAWDKARTYTGQTFWYTWVVPWTYSLFYRLYKKNSDIRRCIIELQETVWSHWYVLKDKNSWEEKKDIMIEKLLKDYKKLKNLIIRDLSITGNLFILKEQSIGWQVIKWNTMDPRTVRIIADQYWDIYGYRQIVKWETNNFSENEVLQSMIESDPDNELFGISIMEALMIDVLSDNEANLSNYNFFKNGAIPGSLIILDEDLSEDEAKNVIARMKKQFSWGKNSHKTAVVQWIKDIKKMQQTMSDMEFLALRKFNTERITAGFGVPKVILNYTEWVNYSNADMQYTKFIENTIRPWERRIEDIFNELIQEINPNIEFKIIDQHISDADVKTDLLKNQIQTWLKTVNEWREELWLEPFEWIEEADTPLILNNVIRLEDTGLTTLQVNPDEEWQSSKKQKE